MKNFFAAVVCLVVSGFLHAAQAPSITTPQVANTVLAGPPTGAAAIATWRGVVGADITSGVIAPARLGATGTPSAATILRGDGAWVAIPTGVGDALVANPLNQFAATTSTQLLGIITDPYGAGNLVFSDNIPHLTLKTPSGQNAFAIYDSTGGTALISYTNDGNTPQAPNVVWTNVGGSVFMNWTGANGNFATSGNVACNGVFSGVGSSLTALNGTNISSGTVAPARLGTGSGGATKFLREDSTWQTVSAGTGTVTHTGALTANAIVLGNGTDDIKPLASLGTSAQVLTSNGAGTPPTWQTPASGAAFSAITTGTNTTAVMTVGAGATLLSTTTGTLISTGTVANAPVVAGTSTAGTLTVLTASAAIAGNVTPGAATGGAVTITTGAAARLTSGNADGGLLTLTLGNGIGTGLSGGLTAKAWGTTIFQLPAMNASYAGANNCLAGTLAGSALTSGARTTAFGVNALAATTSNSDNTAFGYNALTVSTSQQCTAVGAYALAAGNGSGTTNTAVGYKAGTTITSGADNVFIGANAGALSSSTSANNVVVGSNAMSANANCQNNIVIGTSAASGATVTNSVVIGYSANSSNTTTNATIIGYGAVGGSGTGGNTVLGYSAGATISSGTGLILLGSGADVNTGAASNTFVAGSTTFAINDVYFGKGILHATPTNYTINGTGASGTNIAGANITIGGGKGTGTGAGGEIVFSTAVIGTTGATLQSLSEKVRIKQNGNILFTGTTSGTNTFGVPAAAGTSTNFILPATNGTNGHVLISNGSGTTSWAALPVVSAPSGSYVNTPAVSRIENAGGSVTVSSTTPTTTGLSVTIVTQTATSRVRIDVCTTSASSGVTEYLYLKLKRGGTLIGPGNNSIATLHATNDGTPITCWYVDTPGAAGSYTYELFENSDAGGQVWFYLNSAGGNGASMMATEILP